MKTAICDVCGIDLSGIEENDRSIVDRLSGAASYSDTAGYEWNCAYGCIPSMHGDEERIYLCDLCREEVSRVLGDDTRSLLGHLSGDPNYKAYKSNLFRVLSKKLSDRRSKGAHS